MFMMSKSPYSRDFTNWGKFTSTALCEKLNKLGIEAKKGKARRQAQLNVHELGIDSDAAEERLEELYGMRLPEVHGIAKAYRIPTGNGRIFDLVKNVFIHEYIVQPHNNRASNTASTNKRSGPTLVQEATPFLRGGQGRVNHLRHLPPAFSKIQTRALGQDSTGSSLHDMLVSLRNSQAQHQATVANALHGLDEKVRMIRKDIVSVQQVGEASDREFEELITMLEEKMSLCDCDLGFE